MAAGELGRINGAGRPEKSPLGECPGLAGVKDTCSPGETWRNPWSPTAPLTRAEAPAGEYEGALGSLRPARLSD